MSFDNLFKKLSILQEVKVYRDRNQEFQKFIQKLIDDGNIIQENWNERFDYNNNEISWRVEVNDDKIVIIRNGHRESQTRIFNLINFDPEVFLFHLIDEISVDWKSHLENEFRKEEDEKKKKRLLQIEAYLLR